MPKHGKNHKNKLATIDRSILYTLEEGIKVALSTSYAKFDETFDIAMKLGVDLNSYVETTGCKSLKEYAEINENWSAVAMVGLFLEYVDELNGNVV